MSHGRSAGCLRIHAYTPNLQPSTLNVWVQVVIEMVPSVKMLRNAGSSSMTGHVALRLASLAARGLTVVPIACAEWRAMELSGHSGDDHHPGGALASAPHHAMRHPFASVADAKEQFLIHRLAPHMAEVRVMLRPLDASPAARRPSWGGAPQLPAIRQ